MRELEKVVGYFSDDLVSWERFWLDDKCHRVDGPAFTSYYHSGRVEREIYYIEGERLTKEEYTQTIKEAKELDKANQLLDPRSWVRELGRTT